MKLEDALKELYPYLTRGMKIDKYENETIYISIPKDMEISMPNGEPYNENEYMDMIKKAIKIYASHSKLLIKVTDKILTEEDYILNQIKYTDQMDHLPPENKVYIEDEHKLTEFICLIGKHYNYDPDKCKVAIMVFVYTGFIIDRIEDNIIYIIAPKASFQYTTDEELDQVALNMKKITVGDGYRIRIARGNPDWTKEEAEYRVNLYKEKFNNHE